MAQHSVAYDFSRFEQTAVKQTPETPALRVVKTGKKAKQRTKAAFAVFKAAFCALALALALTSVIYTQAVLTEVGENINAASRELENLKSENGRLSAQLESQLSLRNIEQYAAVNLGLSKLEPDQIEYVNLSGGDKTELASPQEPSLWDQIKEWFEQLMS